MTKFEEKNKENIDRLDKFIAENEADIIKIIISAELETFFIEHYKMIEGFKNHFKLGKIRVIVDYYQPPKRVYFIRRSESIDFNIPCMCGIYSNEPHP